MRTVSRFAAAVVALASAGSVASAAVNYTLSNLGGIGGTGGSRAAGIGPTNLVGGTAYSAGNTALKGLTYSVAGGGAVTRTQYELVIGTGSTSSSQGLAVGGVGGETIVGFALNNDRETHAISGAAGVTTDLHGAIAVGHLAGATTSRAIGINADGDIVGHAKVGSTTQGFILTSGNVLTAVPLHGTYANTTATGINNHGAVVGYAYNGTWSYAAQSITGGIYSNVEAFVYDQGTLTGIGALGTGTASLATAINAAGDIVGQSTLTAAATLDVAGHAFIYSNGVMTQLSESGIANVTRSIANDINDTGEVVGSVKQTGQIYGRAFLYRNGAMVDLNAEIAPGSGWTLIEATGINNDGYITGYGIHNGQTEAFLLSPIQQASIPEPAGVAMIVTAMGLLLRRK